MTELNFKQFIERSLGGKRKPGDHHDKKKPENYLDGIERELGIKGFPDRVDVANIGFPEENLYFNQIVFKVSKPIEEKDPFVTVFIDNIQSPNLDQRVYRKTKKGMIPYDGDLNALYNRPFLISKDQFSKMVSRGWEVVTQQQQSPGGGLF